MTMQAKNNLAHDAKCSAIGSDMENYEQEREDLRTQIYELNIRLSNGRHRINNIEQELDQISAAQDIARTSGGALGPVGGLAGIVAADVIAYARRKNKLESELQRWRSHLCRIEHKLQQAGHRLDNVNYLLERLSASFKQLGCGLSHRPYN